MTILHFTSAILSWHGRALVVFLFSIACAPLSATPVTYPPERRAEQYQTDSGYLVVPLPYSIPGIGEGYFLMGYFSNILDTTTDAFVVRVMGDAEGYIAQLDEAPLYKKHLFLNVTEQRVDKAAVNKYKTRGMDNGKNDYNLIEVNQADAHNIGLTVSLFNRRFEYNITRSIFDGSVIALRDSNWNLISAFNPAYQFRDTDFHHSVKIDLTDDYLDPRRGVRFKLTYQDVPGDTVNDPDYFRIDTGLTFYLPFRRNDTLALNYYQSDAHVTHIGNTDPASIRAELGTNCQPTDTTCLIAEEELVNDYINERTYGTATPLGGDNRLRAYPQGRFSGGHMAFAGAEYRWNFVQDAIPFDYFIWKDVTTTLQLAFFAEAGTVAEHAADLWKDYRTSIGVGGRIVSASGSVYRAEIAHGDEGNQFIVYFYYPWK